MAATFYTELSLVSNLFAVSNICLLKSIADEIKKKKSCALIQSVCFFKVTYFHQSNPGSLSTDEQKGWPEDIWNTE